MKSLRLLPLLLLASACADEIVIREGIGIRTPGSRRSAVHIDPVERTLIEGTWKTPVAGVENWAAVKANANGEFQGGPTGGGYIFATVQSAQAKTMLLEASGHTMVYVNGVPRAGDPYSYGYVALPIALRKGTNELLFLCGRGRLQAKLTDIAKPLMMDLRDGTLPDIVEGVQTPMLAGIVVRNATDKWANDISIQAESGGQTMRSTAVIPPMGVRKIKVQLPNSSDGKVTLILRQGNQEVDRSEVTLRLRKPTDVYKVTFESGIDGSVQYYAVNPSQTKGSDQALFLSLHGASVEALGQAEAYSSKSWGNLVAATNRRPYGFDWEEVGRMDALEVLALAKQRFQPDTSRVYLTGHSMGGHGTWQIGAHYPNLFAAIAPSAGWISFQTYAGGVTYTDPTPVEKMLLRAGSPSDTLGLKMNYASRGVFVLHGDADDNVPVAQARQMREALAPFHRDLDWFEQKGAGHWWDASPEPGSDAVDFAPIFEFFSRHRIPKWGEVTNIDFTTCSPGISATLHWATIQQQEHPFEFSRVKLQAFPWLGKISGTTSNVKALSLSIAPMSSGQKLMIEMDGQTLTPTLPTVNRVFLRKEGEKWAVVGSMNPADKNPARYGGFKDIFRNRFVMVYGTKGTRGENEWAFNKARYDAESFWYRGNGSVDVVSDALFDPAKYPDRNVILYGNSETNTSFAALLDSEVSLKRNAFTYGGRSLADSKNAGVFFIRPRRDSDLGCVAVVGGTDLVGMRLTERAPFFSSGAAYPDLLVLGIESLSDGTKGVRQAGYFGNDWKVASGDWAN